MRKENGRGHNQGNHSKNYPKLKTRVSRFKGLPNMQCNG